jgi:polyphosphate kinase
MVMQREVAEASHRVALDDPSLYINRDLGRLRFILQVLEEAMGERHPLIERAKFLAIVSENLDEFFMIRVARLVRRVERGKLRAPSSSMTRKELLQAIRQELLVGLSRQYQCWRNDVSPALAQAGVRILDCEQLDAEEAGWLRQHIRSELLRYLTVTPLGDDLPFSHIVNLDLYLAVLVSDDENGCTVSLVHIPDGLPRLVSVPRADRIHDNGDTPQADATCSNLVWLEDAVTKNLDLLFPETHVMSAHPFRVTRDADREIRKDRSDDLLRATEQMLQEREIGQPVRLELDSDMPTWVRDLLLTSLQLTPSQAYASDGPVGLKSLWELMRLDRPELKDLPFEPTVPQLLDDGESIFATVKDHDILLYHPYDSFAPVVEFFRQAARDPDVEQIYHTLYRVDRDSPVMAALMEAAGAGKRVTVMAELKARFDERNNVGWSRRLAAAGVNVIHGLPRLKTHAKMSLVARREAGELSLYTHLGTGNYHNVTTRIYSDLGYFTSDPDVGADSYQLFRVLAGEPQTTEYRKLLVAPWTMRREILGRIEREIDRQRQHDDGLIILKMNALLDGPCIEALYRASRAGVRIILQVRGMCGLRPGLSGLSENISATSIVGRFLEHTRIYYFHNGGNEEIFLGSADLRPRNLSRRVETLFAVRDARVRKVLRDVILDTHLRDNVQARRVLSDGNYEWRRPRRSEEQLDSQSWFIAHRGMWHDGHAGRH